MPDSPAVRSATSAAPTPVEPTDGAVVPRDAVPFRWLAPPGSGPFTLRVAAASDPGESLVEIDGLGTTVTTLADALPPGPSLWWVRSGDGPWSAPAQFVAGTYEDLETAARETAVHIERQRTEEAKERRRPRGPEPLPERPPAPVWPYASGDALTGAPPLDWSAVPGFGTPDRSEMPGAEAPAPHPLAPLGGEVVDAVTTSLRWSGVPGAVAYDVELSPHADFSREVLALDAGGATELALPGLVPAAGHRLLWRVRARLGDGATAWSKYGRFYPAADAAVDSFRKGMDAARLAERKQRDHDRRVREREQDLIPLHEREEAVTDTATLVVSVGLLAVAIALGLLALLVLLLPF
ncbi:MAG: hypothetical protein AAF791_02485 [Bacteroidota bacterium]